MGLKKPVKIALFSDLHLGFFSTKGMLKRINNIVNYEQVDAVLIAGDLFDMDFGSLKMYVVSGAGFWGPPVRVGVNNEVVILNIK